MLSAVLALPANNALGKMGGGGFGVKAISH